MDRNEIMTIRIAYLAAGALAMHYAGSAGVAIICIALAIGYVLGWDKRRFW